MDTIKNATLSSLLGYAIAKFDAPNAYMVEQEGTPFAQAMVQGAQVATTTILVNMACGESPNTSLIAVPLAVLLAHYLKNNETTSPLLRNQISRVSRCITPLTHTSNIVSVIALFYFGNIAATACLIGTYGYFMNTLYIKYPCKGLSKAC